jgi:hypothetical protein
LPASEKLPLLMVNVPLTVKGPFNATPLLLPTVRAFN